MYYQTLNSWNPTPGTLGLVARGLGNVCALAVVAQRVPGQAGTRKVGEYQSHAEQSMDYHPWRMPDERVCPLPILPLLRMLTTIVV